MGLRQSVLQKRAAQAGPRQGRTKPVEEVDLEEDGEEDGEEDEEEEEEQGGGAKVNQGLAKSPSPARIATKSPSLSSSQTCSVLRSVTQAMGRTISVLRAVGVQQQQVELRSAADSRVTNQLLGLAICVGPVQPDAVIHRSGVPIQVHDLPQEVLDRIRACLPFSAYLRSAAVCKAWQQATFSPRLLDLCWELHPPEPWLYALVMGNFYEAYVFDPEFCKWRKIKLPFMSKNLVHLAAAHNGLVCAGGDEALLIVNPFNCTSKALPKCKLDRFDPVVGLSVDMDACSFKVVVVGSYEAEAWTEVYDSVTNTWTVTSRLPPQRRLALACCLFAKGCFYCWTAGPPEAILVYDLAKNVWREISISLPSYCAHGRLVGHQDKVYLVGLSQGSSTFKSISISEFREAENRMEEVARMPYGIFKDFCVEGYTRLVYYAVSSGDLIYFYARRNPLLVVCNLKRHPAQWTRMEPAGSLCDETGEVSVFSLCVHPRVVRSF